MDSSSRISRERAAHSSVPERQHYSGKSGYGALDEFLVKLVRAPEAAEQAKLDIGYLAESSKILQEQTGHFVRRSAVGGEDYWQLGRLNS